MTYEETIAHPDAEKKVMEHWTLVMETCGEIERVIEKRLDGMGGQLKWLVRGRIFSLLFQQHFVLAIKATSKDPSPKAGDE